MKDQTFHEITLTPREANAALLAHFGMPEGEVRRAISGMTVLRIEVKPPVAAPTAGTADDLPEGEGWVKWAGGERPVPYDATVGVWLRDGSFLDSVVVDGLYWTHRGGPRDIVAYRVRS
ncbi:MAG: hypothetical protein WAT79_04930 [Saprospiraceae bacterium]